MRILIDAMGAPAGRGGMNVYATQAISSWVETYPHDELVLVGGTWCTRLAQTLDAPQLRVVAITATCAPVRFLVQVFLVAWLRVRLRCDFVLSLSPLVSFLVPRRRRACVSHDWRHRRRPEEFGFAQRAYRNLWTLSVRRAGTVFCISRKTELELQSIAPRVRPVLVPVGGDHPRRWARVNRDEDAFRVLTYCHATNKRPELVIDAVTRLSAAGPPVELTLLGTRGNYRDELLARVPAGWTGSVECPGFVPDAEYQRLLQRSDVVCLMSSDEGFGFPAVEAGYFGIPCVVASDSGMTDIHPIGLTVSEPNAEDLATILSRLRETPERVAAVPSVSWSSTVSGLRNRLQQCLREPDALLREAGG
ncbi:glycosyltransferase [Mycobacterium sp. 3519A]|uniref:glycosyltransferase n=1 Tax=Mycobacterium sp. 3519A TaxID=2057184 RepID=UPI000C7DB1DF|nr:glycosyltransferase [Mycobacterium sp. 3519A]